MMARTTVLESVALKARLETVPANAFKPVLHSTKQDTEPGPKL